MFKKVILAATMCALPLGFVAHGLADGNSNPGVLPIHSDAFGKTYGEWAAGYWQWALSFPLEVNPLFDETGEFQDQGQSGQVWFLGASVGFGEWVRECEVPSGKAIFFGVTHAVFWAPEDGETEEELRARVNASMDGATTLECTVDGVPLENLFDYRAETPAFTIPDDLLIDFGLPPGDRLAVGDGYWILLAPLSRGEHEIHFYMEITEGEFAGSSHDVTYLLTIGN